MLLAPWEGHRLSTCRGLPRTIPWGARCSSWVHDLLPHQELDPDWTEVRPQSLSRQIAKSRQRSRRYIALTTSALAPSGFCALTLHFTTFVLSAQLEAGAPGAGWAFPPTPPTHCIFPHLSPPSPNPSSSRTKQAVLWVELYDPQKMCWGS